MNTRKKVIKVANFNLLNLVLPEKVYYDNQRYSVQDYEKKIEWISYMLQELNADIVAFEEVFHKEALEEAVAKSGIYSGAQIIVANETGDLPRVAILSRFPIKEYRIFEDFPQESIIDVEEEEGIGTRVQLPFKKFSRPVLKASIEVHNGFTINCYVVHLKSKRPLLFAEEQRENPVHLAKAIARSMFLRASESAALRTIMMEALHKKDIPVIAFGDLNDSSLSVTTQIISGEIPHKNLPHDIKIGLWDVLLHNIKDIQARKSYHDFYYTYIHNGHYESLDYILVSEELVGENPRNLGRVGYVKLYNDHLIDRTLTNEKTKRWKTDHGIVLTSIDLYLDKIERVFKSQEF
jgi:endonuclease/exonuclease/phosphatase family metal-dependent hydrolase